MRAGQEQRRGGKRRTRYGVLLVAVLLLGVWFLAVGVRREPSYQGLALSEWLEGSYGHDGRGYWSQTSAELETAMQHMGTNAIPHLVSMVGYRASPLVRVAAEIHPRLVRALFEKERVRRQRGMMGLKAMGPAVTNAIPVLLGLWPRERHGVEEAINVLGSSYFSNVVQVMGRGTVETRIAGMHVLAGEAYDFKREEVVAVWMECLKDPEPRVRLSAARLIRATRPVRAQMAVEALEAAMKDGDAEVAAAAKEAVGKLGGGL